LCILWRSNYSRCTCGCLQHHATTALVVTWCRRKPAVSVSVAGRDEKRRSRPSSCRVTPRRHTQSRPQSTTTTQCAPPPSEVAASCHRRASRRHRNCRYRARTAPRSRHTSHQRLSVLHMPSRRRRCIVAERSSRNVDIEIKSISVLKLNCLRRGR